MVKEAVGASSSSGHQMQSACSTFSRGTALAFKPAQQQQRRPSLVVRASKLAEPAALPVKTLSGNAAGEASIALRVAEEDTATGLVHRYLTTVMRNARQVRHKRMMGQGKAIGPALLMRGRRHCRRRRTPPAACRLAPALQPIPPPPPLQGTASTLTRSEVRGGGRKPYKQKGSGNARRGTRRSPLMPGGGISFGPKASRQCRLAAAAAVCCGNEGRAVQGMEGALLMQHGTQCGTSMQMHACRRAMCKLQPCLLAVAEGLHVQHAAAYRIRADCGVCASAAAALAAVAAFAVCIACPLLGSVLIAAHPLFWRVLSSHCAAPRLEHQHEQEGEEAGAVHRAAGGRLAAMFVFVEPRSCVPTCHACSCCCTASSATCSCLLCHAAALAHAPGTRCRARLACR